MRKANHVDRADAAVDAAVDADVGPDSRKQEQEQEQVDRVAAFQQLVGEVFRANGRLLAVADRVTDDLDMSSARWQVLMVLREESLTAAQLSRRIGVARQSVHATTSKLRDSGLIKLRRNPEHARSALLELTPAGVAMTVTLEQRQVELTELFLGASGITAADITATALALRRMRRNAESRTLAD